MKITRLKSENGFTIVELMIALSVLSIILIIASVLMIQIGSLYTKGVNAASLQNATRNVANDVSSGLQFSGSLRVGCNPALQIATTCPAGVRLDVITGAYIYSFCINRTRYSYELNHRELGDDEGTSPSYTQHVLWRDTMDDPAICSPLDLSTANPTADSPPPTHSIAGSGYEMVPVHVRLTRFNIVDSGNGLYAIDVWTAFGDSDLVKTDDITGTLPGHSICNGGAGTQFCSAANISTTVKGRLE